jgi:hypothetical protein
MASQDDGNLWGEVGSVAGLRRRRWIRDTIVILGIIVALDAVISLFIPARFLSGETREPKVYDLSVPYTHDLLPNLGPLQRYWGRTHYTFQTDRFALRTGKCAPTDPSAEKDRSVFVSGDSMTEGYGLPYEKTFVGLMACAWRKRGLAVWNLGVESYSPAIYWRKILAVAAKTGIHPKENFIFLDMSDASDDAEVYEEKPDGSVVDHAPDLIAGAFQIGPHVEHAPPSWLHRAIYQSFEFLRRNSMIFGFLGQLRNQVLIWASSDSGGLTGLRRDSWPTNPALFEAYGRRGLEINSANLDKIVQICRDWHCKVTLVVYPLPDQIAAHDRDSIQVRYWRDWCAKRDVRFINGFEPFFHEPADVVLRKYFIPGDVHYNEAGHRLLFEKVYHAVWGN